MRFGVKPLRNGLGLTLVELVAGVSVLAMGASVLMPALSSNREQARRQQCAINQKKIIGAYSLWGQDHGGFWPPRCAPADGCVEYNKVWILVDGPQGPNTVPEKAGTAYYTDPGLRNQGLAIVGLPGAVEDVDDYPLNPYVVPGWTFGQGFEVTNCPSDDQTVMATSSMNANELAKRGFEEGDVASAYEFFGTSYFTNISDGLPWKGHGDWAGPIVAQVNKMQGPNFNPDLVFRPGGYVVGMDLAPWYPASNAFIAALTGEDLGATVAGAKWHENQVAPAPASPTWLNGIAYHADGHVTFSRRDQLGFPGAIIPVPSAQCFITAEWSMFPLQLAPQFMSQQVGSICPSVN
jgi:type II secretory pathway pseudopilin PulG